MTYFPFLNRPAIAILAGAALTACAAPSDDVYIAPPAAYASLVAAPSTESPANLLRSLSVEERAGVARTGDLVRVPLFFAQGECRSLDELELVPADAGANGAPLVWQADDIRRGPDGGISRVHLWFAINLGPGEKRRFLLLHRPSPAPTSLPPTIRVAEAGGELTVKTDDGTVRFGDDGSLRALTGPWGEWNFGSEGAFPRVAIHVPAAGAVPATRVVLDRKTPERTVEWAAGPVFVKIRLGLGRSDGVHLEQVYRIPRDGGELAITRAVFPGNQAGVGIKENLFLEGRLEGANHGATLTRIPAGIRFGLRAEHAYTITTLEDVAQRQSLLAVPLVIGGGNGVFDAPADGAFSLRARGGLERGGEGEKQTLYGYWSEVRLVPAASIDPIAQWKMFRDHVQPLVAVVDEPGATVARLHTALSALAAEMKPVGWRQDAGRALMWGQLDRMKKILPKGAAPKEADVANLVAGAVASTAQLTKQGQRKLREDEKGRAYGGLDPYHVTYTQSAAAAIAVLTDAPPSVNAVNLAMATGVRQVGGKVDAAGFPYVDCFNRTLNMQLGPVLFGLTAGAAAGQDELVRFYRDLANAPPVQAVFGRAQRPYTGAPATSPDQTDYLYQAICDFWLRTTELLAGENLKLHPLAYARYTDCIDVMADLYHGVAARDKPGDPGLARANFFRGQAHTHRWLGWSCSPYIRLLEDPAEKSAIGLTEAIHYTDAMKGRWKNWPDLTFYILADVLVREGLAHAERPSLPAAPTSVDVRRNGAVTELAWPRTTGATDYRVYRAKHAGGPYVWLNSPYFEHPTGPTQDPHYTDQTGSAGDVYVVTAVDAKGRESAWPDAP